MRMCFFLPQDIKIDIEFFSLQFGLIFPSTFITLYTILRKVENLWPRNFFVGKFIFFSQQKSIWSKRCSVLSVHPLLILNYAII